MEAVEISWMHRKGHLQYVSEFVNVATQYVPSRILHYSQANGCQCYKILFI